MAWRMPVTEYRLCAITPSGMVDIGPLAFSPQAALNRDPGKFFELLEEMQRVARKYEQDQAQMEMWPDDNS